MLIVPNVPERLVLDEGDTSQRTFLLKVPAPIERAKWRNAVTRSGGRLWGLFSQLAALRQGLGELMAESPPELRDAMLAKIDAHEANLTELHETAKALDVTNADAKAAFVAAGQKVRQSGRALAVIEKEVLENYPVYGQMVADDEVYYQIAGIEGARMFLTGWEGIAGPFKRLANVTSDATLAQISEADFAAIGRKLEEMTRLTETQRKNSQSPPITPLGGETAKALPEAMSGTASNSTSEINPSLPAN